jgi:hypothetical protein
VVRGRFNGVAESGGKTWRKKIGRPAIPVHSTVMDALTRTSIAAPR